MIQQLPPGYTLPSAWQAQAARFRLLASDSGLIGGCDPRPDGEGEIVVCAATPEQPYRGPAFAAEGPIGDQIGEQLHVRIGPVELGSIKNDRGERALGARIRF